MNAIESLHLSWVGCTRCGLCHSNKQVFSDGPIASRVVIIGEGPGAVEDRTGKPFMGPAGQYLNQELLKNGIHREEVFLTNAVRSWARDGVKTRQPNQKELDACKPLLLAEIKIIQPRFILVLGAIAAKTLLNYKGSLSSITGKWVTIFGIPTLVTWHPAAILWASSKNPEKYEQYKQEFERDIREISARLASEVTAIIPEKTIIL